MPLAFDLPKELEARRPPELRGLARDGVSLLVSDVRSRTHTLAKFGDIADYLREGDLLVANDSATIPAALTAEREGGAQIALHLSTRISETLWIVEPRKTLIGVGERLSLAGGGKVELLAPLARAHARLWYGKLSLPCDMPSFLQMHGRPIAYGYVGETFPMEYYQTIFARRPGSVEMPSAARPFTLRVLDSLYHKGVNVAPITLHCGVASPETHEPPLDEAFNVPPWTADAVNATRANGGRIIAVGTTTVRALESAADENGRVVPMSGWTSHIVDPAHPPHVANGLLTGFHEPRASHLNMLEAFAPHSFLRDAYERALSDGLLWHEFGDSHLVL